MKWCLTASVCGVRSDARRRISLNSSVALGGEETGSSACKRRQDATMHQVEYLEHDEFLRGPLRAVIVNACVSG